jgi:hypothetical protein
MTVDSGTATASTITASTTTAEDEESLKLKEALELARQNFYKGKMSMVCLTKAGGYVVKEIKEQTNDSLASSTTVTSVAAESLASSSNLSDPNNSLNSSKLQPQTPKINVEDCLQHCGVGDSIGFSKSTETKSVSNTSVKSMRLFETDDYLQLLKNTTELIVQYSTKKSDELKLNTSEFYSLLQANLENSIKYVQTNVGTAEFSSEISDAVQKLSEVNREFLSYLDLLDENDKLSLKEDSDSFINMSLIFKNLSIQLNEAISTNNSNNSTNKSTSSSSLSSQSSKKLLKTSDSYLKKVVSIKEANHNSSDCIDIKKEIAISILNVGEVLAKTIDYYTLADNSTLQSTSGAGDKTAVMRKSQSQQSTRHLEPVQEKQEVEHSQNAELNELIRLSEQQAELEKKSLMRRSKTSMF